MTGSCPVCGHPVELIEASLIDGGQHRTDGMKEARVVLSPCHHEALAVYPDTNFAPLDETELLPL